MASVAVPLIAPSRESLPRAEGEDSDDEDYEFDFSKLAPLIEATPRLFTGDIKHLIEALNMPDLPSEEMDESESLSTDSPLVQIHGLHLKVMLQQGIHIKYGDRLPPGYCPPPRSVPPLLHQPADPTVRQLLDDPSEQRRPPLQRGSSLQKAPFRRNIPYQAAIVPQQPISLQAGEPALSNSSTSSESSIGPSSASSVSVHSVLDDVPLVCFGEGDEAYITTLAEALKHPRNYEDEELELPKAEGTDEEEPRHTVTIDPMERLNRICVWLFFCTHFELSDDARDVLPKILDGDDDIVDITEVSMEMQGLLSSPRHLHDGNVPITLREATALWVQATGSLRSSYKNDYNNGIKNFVMGLITSANMKYTDAVVIINDALPQALNDVFYRPAPQVLCISVSIAHTPQINAFLQFHMASSHEFRKACAASTAMFLQTFLPIARQFNEAIREGREVTLAQLIGNYTHSVVTNQVVLKRPLDAPSLHLSQKRRREGAANLLSIAASSGLRVESDARPSAFSPVVPRAKADENNEEYHQT